MKKLFLSTENFPYGTGEKTFILPELPELLKYYDVTIISHASETVVNDVENISVLPPEVKVVNLDIKLPWYRQIKYLIRFFFDRDGLKETKEILKSRENILQRLYQSIGFYGLAMENFRMMDNLSLLPKDEEAIYYSYWYFYYTYSMTRNRKLFPNMKLVTRTHGFDLYAEQYKGIRQPFKRIMDKKLDGVIFAANYAKGYYLEHFADNKEDKKYIVCKLGVPEAEITHRSIEGLCLLSCSFAIPRKRIELIIQALALLQDESVHWIHIGGGESLEQLKSYANVELRSKDNITYEFKGYLNSSQIQRVYEEEGIDAFIITSALEGGCPVAIQEAMSHGIPIIGTAVGGITEMIQGNGLLLPSNPSPEVISETIKQFYYMEDNEKEKMAKKSYEIWKSDYNTIINRKKLVDAIHYLEG
ncbi:MAG: glycosyltransferase [Lachnospiraceae bacterium]|nr:glycosyltransferase [Lachnospiraceae bacterium]